MKKKFKKSIAAGDDNLEIPELPPEFFKNAVAGKYYARMMTDSNVVRIAPELKNEFPNEETVNEALRLVKQLREVGKKEKAKKSA